MSIDLSADSAPALDDGYYLFAVSDAPSDLHCAVRMYDAGGALMVDEVVRTTDGDTSLVFTGPWAAGGSVQVGGDDDDDDVCGGTLGATMMGTLTPLTADADEFVETAGYSAGQFIASGDAAGAVSVYLSGDCSGDAPLGEQSLSGGASGAYDTWDDGEIAIGLGLKPSVGMTGYFWTYGDIYDMAVDDPMVLTVDNGEILAGSAYEAGKGLYLYVPQADSGTDCEFAVANLDVRLGDAYGFAMLESTGSLVDDNDCLAAHPTLNATVSMYRFGFVLEWSLAADTCTSVSALYYDAAGLADYAVNVAAAAGDTTLTVSDDASCANELAVTEGLSAITFGADVLNTEGLYFQSSADVDGFVAGNDFYDEISGAGAPHALQAVAAAAVVLLTGRLL